MPSVASDLPLSQQRQGLLLHPSGCTRGALELRRGLIVLSGSLLATLCLPRPCSRGWGGWRKDWASRDWLTHSLVALERKSSRLAHSMLGKPKPVTLDSEPADQTTRLSPMGAPWPVVLMKGPCLSLLLRTVYHPFSAGHASQCGGRGKSI